MAISMIYIVLEFRSEELQKKSFEVKNTRAYFYHRFLRVHMDSNQFIKLKLFNIFNPCFLSLLSTYTYINSKVKVRILCINAL